MKELDSKIQNLTMRLEALKLAKIEALSKEIESLEKDTSINASIVSVTPNVPTQVKANKVDVATNTVSKRKEKSPLPLKNGNYNVHGYRKEAAGVISYGVVVIDDTGQYNPRRSISDNSSVKMITEEWWKANSKFCFRVVTKNNNVTTHETIGPIINCDITADSEGGIGRVYNVKKFDSTLATIATPPKDISNKIVNVVPNITDKQPIPTPPPLVIPSPVVDVVVRKGDVVPTTKMTTAQVMATLRKNLQSFSMPKNHPNLMNDLVLKKKGYDHNQKNGVISIDDNVVGRIVEVALHTKGPDSLLWENRNRDDSKAFDFLLQDLTIDVKGTIDPTCGGSNDRFDRGIFIENYKISTLADILILYSVYEDAYSLNFDCRGWISKEDIKHKINNAENGLDKREEFVWVRDSGLKYKIKVAALNHL